MNNDQKTLRIFQVVSGVLALAVIGLLIWGITTNQRLNSEEESGTAAINADQSEIDRLDSEQDDLNSQVSDSKSEVAKVKAKLKLEKSSLAADEKQISELKDQLQQEEAAAAKDKSDLQAQLTASQTKEKLAATCAKVLARGLVQIYDDVNVNTLKEVSQLITKASNNCQGVVSLS